MILLFISAEVWADDIEKQISKGSEQYRQGNYTEAVKTLQSASSQIQERQTDELIKLFPKPLSGWKAQKADGEYFPLAIMGGGISANREYLKKKSREEIKVEIITNAPLVQGVLLLMNNPFLASQSGFESIKIKSYPAVKEFRGEAKEGKISIIVQNRMLIQVEGRHLMDDQPLHAYAEKINYPALEKFLSQ